MPKQTEALMKAMRAVARQLFPYRDADRFEPPDAVLVLGVTLRLDMEQLKKQIEQLQAQVATLQKQLAPPPPTREQILGISRGKEDCV